MIENFKLHVFRVVADTLNFSKAAEELHLSEPALTSQVRSLEEGLGIALFDRVGLNAILSRLAVLIPGRSNVLSCLPSIGWDRY
jgi:DNA-binding transcriptional LysR family regulator